jgi:iron complex outermembrane receptor protein
MSAIVFSQVEFFLPYEFFLTLGGSLNYYHVQYDRLSDTPPFRDKRNFDPELSPRIAVLKKLNQNLSIYGIISKWFSPPTVAELYPSTATFNDQLNPEEGTNYEVGIHSEMMNKKLRFDLTAYSFQLSETIVVRRTADGADYFVNAGSTSQKGIEANVSWSFVGENRSISFTPWISYTYNHYKFTDYTQDVNNYSGNELTGVPPNILVSGLDFRLRKGLYGNINYTYTSELPLNDANTDFADSYNLLGAKIGYRFILNKNFSIDIFGGVDNLLDETYSLGNDLNAFGGRYYNAAPLRNFFLGIRGNLFTKNE